MRGRNQQDVSTNDISLPLAIRKENILKDTDETWNEGKAICSRRKHVKGMVGDQDAINRWTKSRSLHEAFQLQSLCDFDIIRLWIVLYSHLDISLSGFQTNSWTEHHFGVYPSKFNLAVNCTVPEYFRGWFALGIPFELWTGKTVSVAVMSPLKHKQWHKDLLRCASSILSYWEGKGAFG